MHLYSASTMSPMRYGGCVTDAHIAPGYVCSLETDPQPYNLKLNSRWRHPKIKHAGSISWKRLHAPSRGHARDDDDDDGGKDQRILNGLSAALPDATY